MCQHAMSHNASCVYLKVLVKTMQVRAAMRKEEVEAVIKAESVKDNVSNKLNVAQTLKIHLKNTGKGQKNGKRRREWKTTRRHCGKFSLRAAEAVGLSLASEKSFPKTWKTYVLVVAIAAFLMMRGYRCRKMSTNFICIVCGMSVLSQRRTSQPCGMGWCVAWSFHPFAHWVVTHLIRPTLFTRHNMPNLSRPFNEFGPVQLHQKTMGCPSRLVSSQLCRWACQQKRSKKTADWCNHCNMKVAIAENHLWTFHDSHDQ